MYAPLHHRRAALIQERLPHVSAKPVVFPAKAPSAPLGSWTLLSPDRMLAAARCSSPFANGEVAFVEDRTGPPNRAYLKLWEALVRLGRWPGPGERCLDLGASPGGWTWVLARLGATVVAVDKAPLDPKVAAMPGVDLARRKRLCARARERRRRRLAVLRHRLLSGAAAAAGRDVAVVRPGAQFRLHAQVPGRDRSRCGGGLCRDSRGAGRASAPQQARADVSADLSAVGRAASGRAQDGRRTGARARRAGGWWDRRHRCRRTAFHGRRARA